jgi:hypothetical protein
MPLRYQSVAVAEITAPGATEQELHHEITAAITRMRSRSSLADAMQQPGLQLYKPERERLPVEDVVARMRRDLRIEVAEGPSPVVTIAYAGESPEKAQRTVQYVITMLTDELIRVSPVRNSAGVAIDSPPTLPREPLPGSIRSTLIYGVVIGFSCGLVALLMPRWPFSSGDGPAQSLPLPRSPRFALPQRCFSRTAMSRPSFWNRTARCGLPFRSNLRKRQAIWFCMPGA